ncbi:TonB-dependent receptor [Paludibacter sp. 221]|nr:TonB-dependent receptor [Paludibacter sp. 221]
MFLGGTFLSLKAQTVPEDSVVHRNVTVEREYRPVIQDAGKINSLPYFIEPKVVKMNPNYTTDFSKPLNVDQNIHYLSSAELTYNKKKNKEGFARLGIGTGFNSLADFAFPLFKKPDMKLDFILSHYGLFNSKAHSTTQAGLAFDKKFRTLDFYAGISGSHEWFKYYGDFFNGSNMALDLTDEASLLQSYPPNYMDGGYASSMQYLINDPSLFSVDELLHMPAHNTIWRMNAYAGIASSPTTDNLRYSVDVGYNLFNARLGMTEQQLDLKAVFDTELFDNRFGVIVGSQNQFYSTKNDELTDVLKNYYVFSLNPYYSIERENWDLRLGVKSSFSFAHGRGFSPSPDVYFEWRAVPRFLSVYAGVTGDYQINTLNRMYAENCFLNPDVSVDDTYTPVDFYAGVKLKPVTGLLLDAYIQYKIINNQYFYVNKECELTGSLSLPYGSMVYTNRFDVVYSNATQLRVGGRISYNYHNKFNVQFSAAYNNWNVADFNYAWHKPAFEADFSTNVRITPELNVYGNVYLAGKRYAKIGDVVVAPMDAKVDINLGASYAVREWLSAFLRVNNLINSKYEQWHGYEAQGFNVMGGVSFNF